MKKLEEIPKKQIFEVPEGYFDKLPAIIQSRVAARKKYKWVLSLPVAVRLAVPAFVLIAAVVLWTNRSRSNATPENILTSVETEHLIAYLNESDITTEELLDHVQLGPDDVSKIEESAYEFNLNDSDLEDILIEIEP